MMLLQNKYALITGASRGIGKAIALKFIEEGACVVLCSKNEVQLEETRIELLQHFKDAVILAIKADLTVPEDITHLFAQIKQNNIQLDILINNAGVMKDAPLMMAKKELYDDNFDINVKATVFVTQQAIKHFIRKKSGAIVNITSVIGQNGASGQSIYAASKAAIIGFTKSLSKELAPLNIRVNGLAPGFVETDLTKHFNEEQREKILSGIGLKRAATPEDIANVALFLSSHLSDYVTGQIIGVNGGMII